MIERQFTDFWKKIDFSEYNEMDIREEFIAPLLGILGYSKNTINGIIREKSLELTEPFQRVGRKMIRIDYAPTIRLKSFWILEAKPGNIRQMDSGDLLQAYLYATHPEIQAEYIVLCNGWKLCIYDVHQINNWNKPFFEISQSDCESKFDELFEILSAKTMLAFRRKQLLQQIRNTFEVELDKNQWLEFVREFNSMKIPLEKIIDENVWNLQRTEFQKREKNRKTQLQNEDIKVLLSRMEMSGPRTREYQIEYCRRLKCADADERANLLRLLMQRYYGRCKAEFKCDCLGILLYVVKNELEIAKSPFLNDSKTMLCDVITGNMTYHKDSPLLNALAYLDKICCKFVYVVLKKSSMERLGELIENKKKYMDIEDIIIERPSVAREMVMHINVHIDYLWLVLSRENSVQDIWMNIHVLEYIIGRLGCTEMPKYKDGNDDFLWYDFYGDTFDYLFRVSHMMLHDASAFVEKLDINEEMVRIIQMEEKDALKYMPKMPKWDGKITEEEKTTVMKKIVMALMKTTMCMEQMNNKY